MTTRMKDPKREARVLLLCVARGAGPAPMRNDSRITSTSDDGFRRIEVITGVGRRRRWTDEEKAWIVAESLDPATTVSAVGPGAGVRPGPLFVLGPRGPRAAG